MQVTISHISNLKWRSSFSSKQMQNMAFSSRSMKCYPFLKTAMKKIFFFFSKKIESSFVTLLIEKTDMINSPYPLHGYTCTCILGSSGEVYWIQHYVIKFVSDPRKVVWFSPGTSVSSTNKTDCNDITEILLNVALNTINLT